MNVCGLPLPLRQGHINVCVLPLVALDLLGLHSIVRFVHLFSSWVSGPLSLSSWHFFYNTINYCLLSYPRHSFLVRNICPSCDLYTLANFCSFFCVRFQVPLSHPYVIPGVIHHWLHTFDLRLLLIFSSLNYIF